MWSIYPTQIQAIVDAMKPNLDEVQDAADISIADKKLNGAQFNMPANCMTEQLIATTGKYYKKRKSVALAFLLTQSMLFSLKN
jgi:citrate lyase beta subunit